MKKILEAVLICVFVSSFAAQGFAAQNEIPKFLKAGFEKYEKEGPKGAIETWTQGSAIEGSKEVLSQANNFKQIEDFYGKFSGYTLVKENKISDASSVYLIDIKYEKGNLYSKFFCYKKPDGQIVITNFNFHTHAEAVWPASVIFGEGK